MSKEKMNKRCILLGQKLVRVLIGSGSAFFPNNINLKLITLLDRLVFDILVNNKSNFIKVIFLSGITKKY